jgi:hypothetical protein
MAGGPQRVREQKTEGGERGRVGSQKGAKERQKSYARIVRKERERERERERASDRERERERARSEM